MIGRVSALRGCIAFSVFVCAFFAILPPAIAGDEDLLSAERFKGLELRSIGPALMAGRIADIAIHPEDDNLWYVAVGSGGVWKTKNAGVTWTPIFDDQASYSIGCVTIDPQDPEVIWVGSGENVGGRHVGYGDGIYRSDDGGATWVRKGLEKSEHISEIVVHPEDSDTLWVAAQGPLWSRGGERGVFLTTDGGATWQRVLGDEDWVGATELVIDPRDPDRLYAATWQRHRNVAAYMGGGPGTALHRSTDGGRSWQKLTQGLPEGRMGKIGLAISPLDPDVLYAAIELDRRTGAVYRSSDRGSSWEKRSDTVSGGTGPHYYQELYASPHKFDRIYLADVRMRVSEDGGKTFERMKEESKHSDNHAMAFRADDPDYLLVGTDGGLYESFDLAENWRFMANLPVTQFYKLAVDDAEPFYNIYGGTQDNATQGGPSRTDNVHGIQNSDWGIILDWDGHQPATEPGNPDIVYAQRQQGYLTRVDRTTGEIIDIQPQPGPGEGPERYNWDAPILVSPHQATRLYFASQRVWRSDDRGDTWDAVSGDLTRNQERLALPIMGETQSWDNAWDISAMSTYNTITSLAESPQVEGLIYAGTDDGLIQVTEPDRDEGEGQGWRSVEVGSLPGVPAGAYVNDIKADLFEADTVYVALDHHKFGEFGPHLLRSEDRGRTWASMRGDLPERILVWRVVQDHVRPELLFAATEFGIYFTVDAGQHWTRLEGGVPTISFRDLAIQRRENDLVGASFGRSFYVLDDYSPLREVSAEQLEQEATLFAPRDAWWYFPRPHLAFEPGRGDQGAAHFMAPNPPFGAVFTYYLKDEFETRKAARRAQEKATLGAGEAVTFPGWEAVERERREPEPSIWLVVRDAEDRIVRRIPGPAKAGFHRVAWDLRYPTPDAVELVEPPPPEWGEPPRGLMVAPGSYQVALAVQADGKTRMLSEPRRFEVTPLRGGTSKRGALDGATPEEVAAFWRQYEAAVGEHTAMQVTLTRLMTRVDRVTRVIEHSRLDLLEVDPRFHELRSSILELDGRFNGLRSKGEPGEKAPATVGDRLFAVSRGVGLSTYGPTPSHRRNLEIATTEMVDLRDELERHELAFSELVRELIDAGAPWLEGEPLP
ncbi:MAG: glycosyl hydrolase [Thermoanaerobaculia bacterium]|nr:glycosyl hydrolase [Thermoanaerobaculia bacterium]